jgi:hypothetical protein
VQAEFHRAIARGIERHAGTVPDAVTLVGEITARVAAEY